MKKLLLALSLLLGGLLAGQTVTINTPGTITSQTFVNAIIGMPAVIVNTTGLVTFDHCQISSVWDGIDSGVDGTSIIVLRGNGTSTTPPGYAPGSYISLHNALYIQVDHPNISGFTSPLALYGLGIETGSPNSVTVFFSGCTVTNCGSILFEGLDSAPLAGQQVNGNTFVNPAGAPPIFMDNFGKAPACNVAIYGNTSSGPIPGNIFGRFYGYYQSLSIDPTAADQKFVITQ